MDKNIVLKETVIMKQNRRIDRLSALFGINIFIAVAGIFTSLLYIVYVFTAFDLFHIKKFITDINWIRMGIALCLLILLIADIIFSAFFVRIYPKNRRDKIAEQIKSTGLPDTGKIIKMEINKKSLYEIEYKAALQLESGAGQVFCFYTVDRNEPLPLGEKWSLFYDPESSYCVRGERIISGR